MYSAYQAAANRSPKSNNETLIRAAIVIYTTNHNNLNSFKLKLLRMPFLYSLRFKTQFEGEDGLLAMFNLYDNIIPSLDITPVKSFFRI